jgi:hypothetical protein
MSPWIWLSLHIKKMVSKYHPDMFIGFPEEILNQKKDQFLSFLFSDDCGRDFGSFLRCATFTVFLGLRYSR